MAFLASPKKNFVMLSRNDFYWLIVLGFHATFHVLQTHFVMAFLASPKKNFVMLCRNDFYWLIVLVFNATFNS